MRSASPASRSLAEWKTSTLDSGIASFYFVGMRLHVGTSGYSYVEWKGVFYPDGMSGAKMLDFYAKHFDCVEINNSFYRVPETKTLQNWLTQVPDSFTFVLKAPQKITHQKKLINCGPDVDFFFNVA